MAAVRPMVKRVLLSNLEKKFYDVELDSQLVTDEWQFYSIIEQIIQGTTAARRIGSKINVIGIRYNVLIVPATVGVGGAICKMCLVHDKFNAGSAGSPDGTNIWYHNGINAIQRFDTRPRYVISQVRQHQMLNVAVKADGTPASAGPPVLMTFYQKVNKRIDFTNNTVDGSSILKDRYHFAFVGGADNCCAIQVNAQVVFTDA